MQPPESGEDTWFLLREGHQYGPYTWEEIWQMRVEGNLYAEDLIWSPALGNWTAAATIDSLWQPVEPEIVVPRPRSRTPIVIVSALVVVAVAAIGPAPDPSVD